MDDLVGKANAGTGLAVLTLLGAIVAILVQPTIGTISDYTSSRWGRRKPYILIGAVLDVVFLAGIATSNTYISVVAFVVLLREGRSWLQIATGAWGLDILKERSFVWLLGSRLFVLMATITLTDLIFFYMSRSIGLSDAEIGIWINVATALIAVTTALTTFPAARLSDRLGR